MPMTVEDLLKLHEATCTRARATMRKKNHDYSNAGSGSAGIFGNLELVDALGLGTCETGIVIRMGDKLSRLATLVQRPAAVEDESVDDTVEDLINYGILLLARRRERLAAEALEAATKSLRPAEIPMGRG